MAVPCPVCPPGLCDCHGLPTSREPAPPSLRRLVEDVRLLHGKDGLTALSRLAGDEIAALTQKDRIEELRRLADLARQADQMLALPLRLASPELVERIAAERAGLRQLIEAFDLAAVQAAKEST